MKSFETVHNLGIFCELLWNIYREPSECKKVFYLDFTQFPQQ